ILLTPEESHCSDAIRFLSVLLNTLLVDSHEGIEGLLFSNCRRDSWKFSIASLLCPLDSLLNSRVLGFYMLSELKIGCCVLMPTEDFSVIRKSRQFIHQSCVHLLWSALKEAPTAGTEQSVSCENCPLISGLDISSNPLISTENFQSISLEILDQLLIPSGMIPMMVRRY
uniref:Uncharacterized protein n=1 Tax=Phlebotomus papatasi TaxID=29031 RepID=A0A1B0F095_PHLPP